jgi:hypothetical protein
MDPAEDWGCRVCGAAFSGGRSDTGLCSGCEPEEAAPACVGKAQPAGRPAAAGSNVTRPLATVTPIRRNMCIR